MKKKRRNKNRTEVNNQLDQPSPVSLQQEKAKHPISESGNNEQRIIRASRQEFFSGPIPPPEILSKYNQIIPNGADRIFNLAEKQQEHRQHLEKLVIKSDIRKSHIGMTFGFLLSLIFGLGGIYLIQQGQSLNGLATLIIPLATLSGIFVFTQSKRKKELKERKEKNDEKLPTKSMNENRP